MLLLNANRNLLLGHKVRRAVTFWQRLKGLLGETDLPEGTGVVLEGCRGVHTCFMRFKIDVAFLDDNGKILKIFPDLPPYRFVFSVSKARRVVELPAGTLASTHTQPGDTVIFLEKR